MPLSTFLQSMTWSDLLLAVVDVLIVAYLFYRLFLLIRGTRAVALLNGVAILLVATTVSRWLDLALLHWLLGYAQLALVIALPIVFQPELRRALEQVGRGRLFARTLRALPQQDVRQVVEAVVEAAVRLSRNRVGAIVVLERDTGLADIAETGITLDAVVSTELLINLFVPNTPLHDGAVLIRGDRVTAASCFLPLTDHEGLDVELGSRHRAALGITEQTDAVALVISEETGAISVAHGGKLIRHLDASKLRNLLLTLLDPEPNESSIFSFFGQRWNSQ